MRTFVEKILNAPAGSIVIRRPDIVMSHDNSARIRKIFEEMGGTYVRQGDYFIPCLSLPADKENHPIGVWGQRHQRYLKKHHRVRYYNLLTAGTLNSYLTEIELQAQALFNDIVMRLSEEENVTENLKATAPTEWVKRSNNIRNRADEIVNRELIFL